MEKNTERRSCLVLVPRPPTSVKVVRCRKPSRIGLEKRGEGRSPSSSGCPRCPLAPPDGPSARSPRRGYFWRVAGRLGGFDLAAAASAAFFFASMRSNAHSQGPSSVGRSENVTTLERLSPAMRPRIQGRDGLRGLCPRAHGVLTLD